MHLSTLLPVTLVLTLAASRPRSNPAAPAVDIPHQSPAFPASAQPLPSLPRPNPKNRAVGLTAWIADAYEEGIVDGTYANLTPAQRTQLNSIKNGSFPGVDPVVLWGGGGNKTAGASGTGNAPGHYALSFASEYGPIVVDGNIDAGTLGITVDIVIFESNVGHFTRSLPKGLGIKVQGRIVRGNILLVQNLREVWCQLQLTFALPFGVRKVIDKEFQLGDLPLNTTGIVGRGLMV